MIDWLVLADDRTGALEVAGAIASRVGRVVSAFSDVEDVAIFTDADHAAAADDDSALSIVVLDVGSRHLSVEEAAKRLAAVTAVEAHRRAFKLDSTLRGNWATTVVALAQPLADRVLVVAAFPEAGRTCRHGVVHLNGEPIADHDARALAPSPKPAEHLVAAGVGPTDVVELTDAAAVRLWVDGGLGQPANAVGDAEANDELDAIAQMVGAADHAADDVLFVGTSASIAAVVAAAVPVDDDVGKLHHTAVWPFGLSDFSCDESSGGMLRVLAVCGSLHPTATAQISALRETAALGEQVEMEVIATDPAACVPVDAAAADRVAGELADRARAQLGERRFDVMIVVGGDTAAAVLGPAPRRIGGVVGVGMPWSMSADGSGPLVVTKAGGFGTPDTLVKLVVAMKKAHDER